MKAIWAASYDRAFRQFDVSETSIFDPPKPAERGSKA